MSIQLYNPAQNRARAYQNPAAVSVRFSKETHSSQYVYSDDSQEEEEDYDDFEEYDDSELYDFEEEHDSEEYDSEEDYDSEEYYDSEDYDFDDDDDDDDDDDLEDEDYDEHKVPILAVKNPPKKLYRVHHSQAVTTYSKRYGFRAADQSTSGPVALKEFHRHLWWSSKRPTRFISTFSSKSHAERWAKSWQERHPEGWYRIMEIKPQAADLVYNMKKVIDRSGVEVPDWCPFKNPSADEYLFFRRIPRDQIFDPKSDRSRHITYDEYEMDEVYEDQDGYDDEYYYDEKDEFEVDYDESAAELRLFEEREREDQRKIEEYRKSNKTTRKPEHSENALVLRAYAAPRSENSGRRGSFEEYRDYDDSAAELRFLEETGRPAKTRTNGHASKKMDVDAHRKNREERRNPFSLTGEFYIR
ncbi:hypothetical protein TWF730_002264 [Orbilia blumenaviensis]|uniref:DUF7587 domain-containing protein n=1 Tax=Orbilia blumenaviensis TaxID=1796055 RepID=A0AAV9UCV8_9PEZI